MDRIELVEVGPRDGLQNIKQFVPTETKIRLIHALAAAGFKRMEIGSFVSPKAIPQMQDMDDVVRGLGPMPGVTGVALVPNSKGARRAANHGVTDLEMVISMTDGHNNSNVGRPTADSIADLDYLLNDVDPEHKLTLRIGLATSFHCPFEGLTPENVVLANIEKMLRIRPGLEFALSDTTGMALPVKVKSLATQALRSLVTTRPSSSTDMIPLALASPTSWPGWRQDCAALTFRWRASAAALTRPAPQATSRVKTWSI